MEVELMTSINNLKKQEEGNGKGEQNQTKVLIDSRYFYFWSQARHLFFWIFGQFLKMK